QNLQEWIDPLFPDEAPGDRRLRLAACMLSDVAWRGHPDYRAEKVLTEVLHGRFGGLDHRGAALIALALYICYGGEAGKGMAGTLERLLHEDDLLQARKIGLALRLGQRFSGGTSSALMLGRLEMTEDKVILKVKADAANMAGETVIRRLEALARVVGRRAAVETA
ncbi:MAG TPA: Ppx/GppA family phosphatase, partial [Sphingomonadales bacterium]